MDYVKAGTALGELVADKQRQYGNSFGRAGDVLRVLYPDGVRPDQYTDMLTVTRVIDKLFRIAQRGERGHDLGGESPWRDVAGYGLLGSMRDVGEFGVIGERVSLAGNLSLAGQEALEREQ